MPAPAASPSAFFRPAACGARLHRQRAEGRWRNAALRRRFIGRSDFKKHIFLARLCPEDEREGQTGLGNAGRRVGRRRDVACRIFAEREHGIVHGRHVTGRDQDLGQACIWPAERLRAQVADDVILISAADEPGRPGRMQPHQRVELVLQDHHHVDPAQQLAQHDALVDALAPAQRIARVAHLFPVLEGGALIIAPELGSCVERRPVGERFDEALRFPVRGATHEV